MAGFAILTVSQIVTYLKSTVEGDEKLKGLYVRGEIGDYRPNFISGHVYFTLKEGESSLRCVMFRSSAARLKFEPSSGMSVILRSDVTLYSRDGTCQLTVYDIQPEGLGAAYLAFEQLKEKLAREGLFAPEHKRPVPRYPRKIGVVTSRSGAALHDIEKILERRWPLGEILLYPVSVQGAESAPQIVKAIETMNRTQAADVLLLGRGGGSADDLSVFNDERVARAVYASTIPVISAVGHETDFAICDFVADLRAPTPSAAAELCSPDASELKYYFDSVSTALTAKARALLEHEITEKIKGNAEKLNTFTSMALASGAELIRTRRDVLNLSIGRLTDSLDRTLERELTRLDGANPAKILKKGFCFAEKEGRPVRSSGELGPGDEVRLRFSDGAVGAKII